MESILYNALIYGSQALMWPTRFFNKKMKLFIEGRKNVFKILQQKISSEDTTIWFHCASLGEFEQGLPIMEGLKKKSPGTKLVVTFFSPSGYEIKKNTPVADLGVYLPLDTPANAKKFLKLVHPSQAFFVKYEFWPNYLFALKKGGVRTYLVSGLFRRNQVFFKPYGGFMRKALACFDHFFVQNKTSLNLLKGLGFENVTVSGDTRFDRVSHQIEMDNSLEFMEQFREEKLCMVCGSTWPEDEKVLLPFMNSDLGKTLKFVIAPHKIEERNIVQLQNQLKLPSIRYTESKETALEEYSILIVDTVGLLTKIYSYADIAYVGGAMGNTGLHNILEPATFGLPIVIGKHFEKFPEAIKLQDIAGLYSVQNSDECLEILQKLVSDKKFRETTGMISGHFVNSHTGATRTILQNIS